MSGWMNCSSSQIYCCSIPGPRLVWRLAGALCAIRQFPTEEWRAQSAAGRLVCSSHCLGHWLDSEWKQVLQEKKSPEHDQASFLAQGNLPFHGTRITLLKNNNLAYLIKTMGKWPCLWGAATYKKHPGGDTLTILVGGRGSVSKSDP